MRMHHDMGGLPAGPLTRTEHEYEPWEKLVDALYTLLVTRNSDLFSVDELRRNVEALAPDVYDRLSYYERWIAAIANVLIQRGVITSEELGRKMQEIQVRAHSQTQP